MVAAAVGLYTHTYPSPVGPLHIAVDKVGALTRLAYHDFRPALLPGTFQENKYACGEVEYELDLYFAGRLRAFTLETRLSGTAFQQEVWRRLCKIPHGTTVSYGEIAARIGRRQAARAVGNAVASNPIAIVVPCHRVLAASGVIGHYARQTLPPELGRRIKQQLLELEMGESFILRLAPQRRRPRSASYRLAPTAPSNRLGDTCPITAL